MLVPGISGATIALMLGVYRRTLEAIASLDAAFFRLLAAGRFRAALRRIPCAFMAALAAGAAVSIVALARVIPHILAHYPIPAKGFFFGLILASLFLMARSISFRNMGVILVGVAGMAGAFWAAGWRTASVKSGADADAKAMAVSEAEADSVADLTVDAAGEAADGTPAAGGTWMTWVSYAGAGWLAASALLLPGLSGASVLMVLEQYKAVMDALDRWHWPVLLAFGAGCAAGLLFCARLVNAALRRYPNGVLSLLIGLMLGSMRVVWPLRDLPGSESTPPPGLDMRTGLAILCCLAGAVLPFFLGRRAPESQGASGASGRPALPRRPAPEDE